LLIKVIKNTIWEVIFMFKYFLASKSPRRKELMNQIGIEFEIMISEREEIITSTVPEEVVKELSLQKALEIERMLLKKCDGNIFDKYSKEGFDGVVIIGADTVVSKDGEIMGKPADEEDSFNMLKKLQGDKHMVSTGVALIVIKGDGKETISYAVDTDVDMYPMSDEEIKEYIATKEPADKAGSYAIQGIGAKFISGINGDYNNVVGLPIGSIYQAIRKL
jgi:septum formation protein